MNSVEANGRPGLTARDLGRQLEAFFPPEVVGWKPKGKPTANGQIFCVPFLAAEAIARRLDAVLGPAAWADAYEFLPAGLVLCRLAVRFDGEWVTKCDVGSTPRAEDAGDGAKAAVTNAFKRAAAKFGVGRYLRDVPGQFAPYDTARKQITKSPLLPAWAAPVAVTEKSSARLAAEFAAAFSRAGEAWQVEIVRLAVVQAKRQGLLFEYDLNRVTDAARAAQAKVSPGNSHAVKGAT